MPPKNPSSEVSLVVTVMEHIENLRREGAAQSDRIFNRIDSVGKDITEIQVRLARGSERIERMRADLDGQQERCQAHSTSALERRAMQDADTEPLPKRRPRVPWWLHLLIGGALAWGGERLAQVLVNALAEKPTAVATVPKP